MVRAAIPIPAASSKSGLYSVQPGILVPTLEDIPTNTYEAQRPGPLIIGPISEAHPVIGRPSPQGAISTAVVVSAAASGQERIIIVPDKIDSRAHRWKSPFTLFLQKPVSVPDGPAIESYYHGDTTNVRLAYDFFRSGNYRMADVLYRRAARDYYNRGDYVHFALAVKESGDAALALGMALVRAGWHGRSIQAFKAALARYHSALVLMSQVGRTEAGAGVAFQDSLAIVRAKAAFSKAMGYLSSAMTMGDTEYVFLFRAKKDVEKMMEALLERGDSVRVTLALAGFLEEMASIIAPEPITPMKRIPKMEYERRLAIVNMALDLWQNAATFLSTLPKSEEQKRMVAQIRYKSGLTCIGVSNALSDGAVGASSLFRARGRNLLQKIDPNDLYQAILKEKNEREGHLAVLEVAALAGNTDLAAKALRGFIANRVEDLEYLKPRMRKLGIHRLVWKDIVIREFLLPE